MSIPFNMSYLTFRAYEAAESLTQKALEEEKLHRYENALLAYKKSLDYYLRGLQG